MSNELITRTEFSQVERAMEAAGFKPEKVKQEISFALQHINKSEQLQKCSRESLQQAVLNISNIGLSLNPAAKESYLIPRWNGSKKTMEAVLEPSYIGLVKLLTNSGSVKSVNCQLVYENDFIQLTTSDNINPVIHRPELSNSKKGNVIGCYAVATLHDGTKQVEWMDIEEIHKIRERSETYKAHKEGKIKSCTWVTDEGEMSRKTLIKRLYKYLPRTEHLQAVDTAIELDNEDYPASQSYMGYLEMMLQTSVFDERKRSEIENELCSTISHRRAKELAEILKNNQQKQYA